MQAIAVADHVRAHLGHALYDLGGVSGALGVIADRGRAAAAPALAVADLSEGVRGRLGHLEHVGAGASALDSSREARIGLAELEATLDEDATGLGRDALTVPPHRAVAEAVAGGDAVVTDRRLGPANRRLGAPNRRLGPANRRLGPANRRLGAANRRLGAP